MFLNHYTVVYYSWICVLNLMFMYLCFANVFCIVKNICEYMYSYTFEKAYLDQAQKNAFPSVIVCFPAIMKFMGDYPIKGQTEQNIISTILKVLK